ncbi:MAG: DUF6773 family protein [Peptococcaceae bacterium]
MIRDERVINQRRKINSEAFVFCFLGLGCILLYRTLLCKQNFSEIWDIFSLFMLVNLYSAFKIGVEGLAANESAREPLRHARNTVIGALVGGVVFMLVFYFTTGKGTNLLELAVGGITFVFSWLVVRIVYFKWSKKQADREIEED